MQIPNSNVNKWVNEVVQKLKPDKVVWIEGSENEYQSVCSQLVKDGVFTTLNSDKYPNCFLARSHPRDVARVESRTFICSKNKDDAGPLNHWKEPAEMYAMLDGLLAGCMQGRTMYVIPYLMGPDGGPFSKVGFELTDSLYVVANMHIMARVGKTALKNLSPENNDFVRGIHSTANMDFNNCYIAHFPEDNCIISINSNYGGNALQGKKCFALRIASSKARHEGWLAEHMLILGITNPQGRKRYICAAFPSACGKTNLAMLIPPKSYVDAGWKVETVGDDIAWLNFGTDGSLYAVNPEAGFFGVAPGTSYKTNSNAMETLKSNTIFTNVALDLNDMTPWWEGMSPPPETLEDWLGNEWEPDSGTKAAHPNSRFTAPARQCPSIDPQWEAPRGVPISAIIFGGRRARTVPLVYEARNWQHGTFIGATIASERTAAAEGTVGELRRDPMAMSPFIGYHAGDYFRHWLNIGMKAGAKLPKIFHVNWFKQDADLKFLWPGFGDNMRVLEWILSRVEGEIGAKESAIGFQPNEEDINVSGLNLSPEIIKDLHKINPEEWRDEIVSQDTFFKSIGDKMPKEIWQEHLALKEKLGLN
jgi:phosphoenolpyruvate carboxykinase (GTP)